jgi:ribosomal protein L36
VPAASPDKKRTTCYLYQRKARLLVIAVAMMKACSPKRKGNAEMLKTENAKRQERVRVMLRFAPRPRICHEPF